MGIGITGYGNQQEMEVWVSGPGDANRLFVYTGVANLSFIGNSEDTWKGDTLKFLVGRRFSAGEVIRATCTMSLARVYNRKTWHYGGWRVDSADADWDDETGQIEVEADVAVRDTDGYLDGVSYLVMVLAKIGGSDVRTAEKKGVTKKAA